MLVLGLDAAHVFIYLALFYHLRKVKAMMVAEHEVNEVRIRD